MEERAVEERAVEGDVEGAWVVSEGVVAGAWVTAEVAAAAGVVQVTAVSGELQVAAPRQYLHRLRPPEWMPLLRPLWPPRSRSPTTGANLPAGQPVESTCSQREQSRPRATLGHGTPPTLPG